MIPHYLMLLFRGCYLDIVDDDDVMHITMKQTLWPSQHPTLFKAKAKDAPSNTTSVQRSASDSSQAYRREGSVAEQDDRLARYCVAVDNHRNW